MEISPDVQSSFQLVATQIESLTFRNNFLELPEDGLKVKTDCEYQTHVFDATDCRGGVVTLTVKVTASAKMDNENRKMAIMLSLTGAFCDNINVPEERFQTMLEINGCAALYSIARAQIISLVAQSVMQGNIILPMTNFFKLKEKESASNKDKK